MKVETNLVERSGFATLRMFWGLMITLQVVRVKYIRKPYSTPKDTYEVIL